MFRSEAQQVLINAGYTDGESVKILNTVDRAGSALTAPRNCPSLFVDRDTLAINYRIMENDSGIIYNLATIF